MGTADGAAGGLRDVYIREVSLAPPAVPRVQVHLELRVRLSLPDFSDVVLVVGSDEIRAHRAILSCSSPVFKRMLTTGRRESIDSKIGFRDSSAKNTFPSHKQRGA